MFKVRLFVLALAGLSAVVASQSKAATFQEDFSTDPAGRGWKVFGDTNLFHWNPTNQNLEVTWDSSQPNSYFYRPLGTILTSNDDFSLEFDLQLTNAEAGGYGFELAVGFLRFQDATNANFLRGAGAVTNLLEFNYFPPDEQGDPPSLDVTTVDTNGLLQFSYDNLPLFTGSTNTYHIALTHPAGAAAVSAEISWGGQPYTSLPNFYSETGFSDFRLDTIAISSYSGAGQDPSFTGSILAQGVVDNFVITTPPAPVGNLTGAFSNAAWQVQFASRSNWLYTLERTADFQTWMAVSPVVAGNGTNLFLFDTNAVSDKAFYRVRANRP